MPIPGGFIPPIQPDKIHVGRGELFVAPVGTPEAHPSLVPLTNGAPAQPPWTYVGATMAAAVFGYNPRTTDIETQQTTMVVGTVIAWEELRVRFTLGELTYNNLKSFYLGAGDGTSFVFFGGFLVPTPLSVLLVAPRRDDATKYATVCLYSADFIDNRENSFGRGEVQGFVVQARARAEITRPLGAQGGYFNPYNTSS